VPTPTTYYAQNADLSAYVEGFTLTDANEIARLIQRAEQDVDNAVGAVLTETNGRKFGNPAGINEKNLRPEQVQSLNRATCAQAEYRWTMGEDFFRRGQFLEQQGPDFAVKGKLPKLAPRALDELASAGLCNLSGRARAGMVLSRPQYDRFLNATRHNGT
jgi:hypothetical protein